MRIFQVVQRISKDRLIKIHLTELLNLPSDTKEFCFRPFCVLFYCLYMLHPSTSLSKLSITGRKDRPENEKQTLVLRQASVEIACFLLSLICDD